MLDSIYHLTLKLIKNQTPIFSDLLRNAIIDVITLRYSSGLLILLHGVISLPDVTSCDTNFYTVGWMFWDLYQTDLWNCIPKFI